MNKVILITGTSKGIGKFLCEYYLDNNIVIGCSRTKSSIDHKNYFHHQLDVACEKEVVSMIRSIYRKFGKIDILINNAGIASMNHILITPLKTVENIFKTNFIGTFLFVRETAKIMVKQKSGRIINFATVATPLNLEGEAIYASSKSAIETFTKISARELAGYGITVNAIGPTPVPTDLIKNVSDEKMKELVNRQAIKRFGNFNDICNVIDFFISEKSDFITGQVIYLGGIN
jgi:3-oxoacyl-[acyl-carrier protein] reductase